MLFQNWQFSDQAVSKKRQTHCYFMRTAHVSIAKTPSLVLKRSHHCLIRCFCGRAFQTLVQKKKQKQKKKQQKKHTKKTHAILKNKSATHKRKKIKALIALLGRLSLRMGKWS